MSRIAVTGSKGTVARALVPRLGVAHEMVPIDLPDINVLDAKRLSRALRGVDTVIHLAGIFGPAAEGKESWRSPHQDPVNNQLFRNTLECARDAGATLFLHASSIHVEDSLGYMLEGSGNLLTANPGAFTTEPASGYGRSKREQEAMLKAAACDFENGAVSIRLGGVTRTGLPLSTHAIPEVLKHEHKVWLDHDDLGDLVFKILVQRTTPNYDVVYAISDNTGRFHDTSNRYGWEAQANSANYIQ